MDPAIEMIEAGKRYDAVAGPVHALKPLSLRIESGACVAILGPSGSGKSTLLNLLAGLDCPSSGHVVVAGRNISGMRESPLAAFRGRHIGVVFQFFQLIPTLTAQENVRLAMDLTGAVPRDVRGRRAVELLAQVGLEQHRDKLPAMLSGGEQQRVAIARALANDPPVLAADEPTGNLDSVNSELIAGIFSDCAAAGRTVVVATHDTSRLDRFDRLVEFADGVLVRDSSFDKVPA